MSPDEAIVAMAPSAPFAGHKRAEVESRTPEFMANQASKPFGWRASHFVEWATVTEMMRVTGVAPGAAILDVGCGNGWTTLFLAEAGFKPLGVDLVPANVELARQRAERWGSPARFEVADMERLDLEERFDAALIFDSLHHVERDRDVLRQVYGHLAPGGRLYVGEPTWLHRLSGNARRTRRELGWLERGFTVRELRRGLADAGFEDVRRFFQGSAPTAARGLAPQLVRLLAARVAAAPQHHIWLTAQRPPG
jgi:SAM-dependent methyltransferase